ncbi:MAG: hypothetical protein HY860_02555 [Chlamydiales bacterium]|nr:hypothetical protein [Chlamydiales bacterium]
MTRMSKQGERRAMSPRKRHYPAKKTGPKKENLPNGYKEQVNAANSKDFFIPTIK